MNALQRILCSLTDEQRHELYSRVFESDDGKLALEDLRMRCFAYLPEFVKGDRDETMLNIGKRSVLLTIETLLTRPEHKGNDNA